jgi:Ca-activated chloride channel family protein
LLKNARVECPSHDVRCRVTDDATHVELDAERAVMDRDFVLTLSAQGLERSYALADLDPAGHVALVSFQPMIGGLAKQQPRSIKIVVDCSGSMAGDSIVQARGALLSILELLRREDRFNIIAFGSHTKLLFKQQEPCTQANLARARVYCDALDADLGGTEIGNALAEAYASHAPGELPEDVLLITDGEVGQWKEVVARAVVSKHRIFTVGVGSSVAEAFVRTLAERTGGVCELVSPNEDMAGRITRHFQRMSATRSANARIIWPDGAVDCWPTDLRHVYEGDTVIAWARYERRPEGDVTFEHAVGEGRPIRQTVRIRRLPEGDSAASTPSTLARLAAAMRLPELDAERGAKEAIAYELVSRWTNYLVVLERAESEKATRLPALRKVQQMLAAGWGGTGVVMRARMPGRSMAHPTLSAPAVFDVHEMPAPYALSSHDAFDADAQVGFVTGAPSEPLDWEFHGLVAILNSAPDRIHRNTTIADLQSMGVPHGMLGEIQSMVSRGMSESEAVLRFLESVAQGPFGEGLSSEVKRALRGALRSLIP